jgi:hypothetical protein
MPALFHFGPHLAVDLLGQSVGPALCMSPRASMVSQEGKGGVDGLAGRREGQEGLEQRKMTARVREQFRQIRCEVRL